MGASHETKIKRKKENHLSENQFFVDSDKLSKQALEKKHRIENDPAARTDAMQ